MPYRPRSHHLDSFARQLIEIIERDDRDFFTTADLAVDRGGLLTVTDQTLQTWRHWGIGPPHLEAESGSILYPKVPLTGWLEECAARAARGRARRRRRRVYHFTRGPRAPHQPSVSLPQAAE